MKRDYLFEHEKLLSCQIEVFSGMNFDIVNCKAIQFNDKKPESDDWTRCIVYLFIWFDLNFKIIGHSLLAAAHAGVIMIPV